MQSSRSRYRHIHPNSPIDMLRASTEAGMASMRQVLNQHKEAERIAQGKCTNCGKDGGVSLKSCSRCKAARYCDANCQLADFKARHKRECANFANPPTTSVFLTKPVAGEKYPQHPVFAHWHEHGVGCWVSTAGRIDCDLHTLTDSIDPSGYRARQERMAKDAAAGRQIMRTHKAAARSLLGMSVLVQNRRKDKTPILLFASRAEVVSQPSMTEAVMRGTAQGDKIDKFTKDRITRAAMGVAQDPWDKVPRLKVSYINGVEIKSDAPVPSNVKDAKEGIIALHTGEYAILQLQFRVGDGDGISKDWEAFGCLESLVLPWAPWDGTSPYSSLLSSLPSAQSPPTTQPSGSPSFPSSSTSSEVRGFALRAPFDQRAVRAHYEDFIERGEEAYMRSHFGDARTEMTRSAESMVAMMGEMLLGQVAEAGNTDVLVRRLRECGLGDIADKIGAR
ncbi:hypothetical protein BV20DRAFT_998254 [Pilatotrama ljubarskyi]|nr:hypothetical protein BV20DRAFT_998254 [Pilatotrama ljubarskyi]